MHFDRDADEPVWDYHERKLGWIMAAIDDLNAAITQLQATADAVVTAVNDLVAKIAAGDQAAIEGAVSNIQAVTAKLATEAKLDPGAVSSTPVTATPPPSPSPSSAPEPTPAPSPAPTDAPPATPAP